MAELQAGTPPSRWKPNSSAFGQTFATVSVETPGLISRTDRIVEPLPGTACRHRAAPARRGR